MSKTANTWDLMKSSWGVLMRDPVLLLFPVVSGVACCMVLLTFIVPAVGIGGGGMRSLAHGYGGAAGYLLLFCYYLCNFFVVFFFNAALVDFVTTRLRGMKASGVQMAGKPITSLTTVNGVRVGIADGSWGLVRASSNKPELVVVVESPASEAQLRALFTDLDAVIREHPEVGSYNQTLA